MTVFELFAKLGLDSSEFDKGLDSASGKAEGFGSKFASGLGTAAKVGAAAVAAATGAAVAFGKSAVDAGMTFDSSMSQVAATMGVTVDEISELRDYAQEMGRTTAFSATEAADALNYMALAGYDAQTSMDMLPTVLNLAAAGGIQLATASDMITDTQSALGLTLEETSDLVDKMAKAASKSNTSVAQLGDAMLTIGGTAKNLAGGTTELSTALGILADNGIKGSEGGTALRNIILSLSAPTDKAAAKMEELGISVFDARGNMRELDAIFGDLNNSLKDMTQGQQINALNEIFNKVDLKSVNALLGTSVDRWDELSGAIDDASGAAQKMADTQLDNLAGDITLFKSALEGAKIAVSDRLTPAIRNLVSFGTDSLSTLTAAFQEGGLSGAMEALGDILSDGLSAIVKKVPEFANVGVQLIKAVGKAIIDNAPLIADTAVELVMSLADGLLSKEGISKAIESITQVVTDIIDWISDNAEMIITAATDLIIALADGLLDPDNLLKIVESTITLIDKLADGLLENLPRLLEKVPELIDRLVNAITDNAPRLIDSALEIMLKLAQGLIQHLPEIIKKAPEIIAKLVDAIVDNVPQLLDAAAEIIAELVLGIVENLPEIVESGLKIVGKLIEGILSVIKDIFEMGKNLVGKLEDGFKQRIGDAKQWGRDLIDNFISGVKSMWDSVTGVFSDLGNAIADFIGFSEPKKGPLSKFHTFAPDMMALYAKGIYENRGRVLDEIDSLTEDMQGALAEPVSASFAATSARGSFVQDVRDAVAGVLVPMSGSRSGRDLTVILELDKQTFARAVYKLNNEETQRVGMRLAGGYAI